MDIGPALVAFQALNIRCVPMTNSLSLNIGVFPGPSLTCLGALGLLGVAGLGHGEDVGYAGLLPPAGLAPRLGHLLTHDSCDSLYDSLMTAYLLRPEVSQRAGVVQQRRLAPGAEPDNDSDDDNDK